MEWLPDPQKAAPSEAKGERKNNREEWRRRLLGANAGRLGQRSGEQLPQVAPWGANDVETIRRPTLAPQVPPINEEGAHDGGGAKVGVEPGAAKQRRILPRTCCGLPRRHPSKVRVLAASRQGLPLSGCLDQKLTHGRVAQETSDIIAGVPYCAGEVGQPIHTLRTGHPQQATHQPRPTTEPNSRRPRPAPLTATILAIGP